MDAYNTDVRRCWPRSARRWAWTGGPDRRLLATGYAEKIVAERVGGTQAGWGARR